LVETYSREFDTNIYTAIGIARGAYPLRGMEKFSQPF